MTSGNIIKLYNFGNEWSKTKNNPAALAQVQYICDSLTEKEILTSTIRGHPFLHEVCDQSNMFEFLQYLWAQPKFRPYWDSQKYLDRYELTVFQRLSLRLYKDTKETQWVQENMRVIPATQEHSNNLWQTRITLATPYKI